MEDPVNPSPYPTGSFQPGRVVWAKVEGHDWWPARVVRRRAVPREVGPPPGGPDNVRTHIPVVFFTARGIPGEETIGLETAEGSTAVGTHALGGSGEGLSFVDVQHSIRETAPGVHICLVAVRIMGGSGLPHALHLPNAMRSHHRCLLYAGDSADEAEYAWLPVDCMKPFRSGDETGNADGSVSGDATLQACVGAADKALADSELQNKLKAEALRADPRALDYHTDSDGGVPFGNWLRYNIDS